MSLLSSLETRLQGSIFLSAVVDATEQVAPSMRAVWLSSVAIADMVYLPGQHVRVQTGALLGMDLVRGDTLRTYSVWRLERAAGRMALCVFDHPGQGPGARWAKTVQVGDVVRFRPPEGKLVTSRHDGLHLFCGDETASAPIAAMLPSLEPQARAIVLLETAAGAEHAVLGDAQNVVRPITRGCAPDGSPDRMVAAVRNAAKDGTFEGRRRTAYIAGEAKTCKALRALLIGELGWRRDEVVLKPFWTPGAKGLE